MPNPNTLFDPTLMASVFPDAANMLPEDPHTAPYDALATRFAERQARLGIAAQAGVSVETAGIVADLLTTAPDGSSLDALERVEGKELVDQYKTAFEASEYLFGLVGEKIPSLEDPRLTEALKRLKPTFEVLKSMNLEPEIVIYPRHRSLDWWKQVGAKLQADPTINKDGRIKNGGLYVYDTIANNWDSFTNPNRQPVEWTLQVSSATEAPFITSVTSYGYTDSDNTAPEGKVNLLAQKLNLPTVQHRKKKDPVSSLQQPDLHPEIEGYLTHQFTRLATGRPPLDTNSYSWLKGKLDNGRVPLGFWRAAGGQVYLSDFDAGSLFGDFGVRPSGRG